MTEAEDLEFTRLFNILMRTEKQLAIAVDILERIGSCSVVDYGECPWFANDALAKIKGLSQPAEKK
jgi:hypothetical protein